MRNRKRSDLAPLQWRIVYAVFALTPVLVMRSAAEPFHLPKATLLLVAGTALFAVLLIRTIEERRFAVVGTPFLAPYLLYIASAAVVSVTSMDRALSLWGEYRYFVGLLVLLAIAVVAVALLSDMSVVRYRMVAGAIVLGAAPVTLYALIQAAGADPFTWSGDLPGVFSTMANPNFLAGYLAVVFPLVLMVAVYPRVSVPIRVAAGLLAVLVVATMFFTRSFQGPVALAVGAVLPLGLLLLRRVGRRIFLAILAGGGVITAVGLLFLADAIRAQLADGLRERLMIWEAALDVFRGAPLVGRGLSTFGLVFTPNRPVDHALFYGFTNPEHAHNVALNHLAEGGLLLLLPWLAAVAVVTYMLGRGLKNTEGERQLLVAGFGGVWLAYHAQALVSIDLPVTVLLAWTSATIIVGLTVDPARTWSWTGQRRGGRASASTAARWAVVGIALVAAWSLVVPLRADRAAASGFKTLAAGDVTSGLEQMEAATSLAPYRATYWLLLASAYERVGDLDGALDALQAAATRDVGSSQQALAVGRFADRTGDLALAAESYGRAVARDPNNPRVLDNAAEFFDSIGEMERSRELSTRARALRER